MKLWLLHFPSIASPAVEQLDNPEFRVIHKQGCHQNLAYSCCCLLKPLVHRVFMLPRVPLGLLQSC